MHADAPAGGDQDVPVMEGVVDVRQPPIGSIGGGIDLIGTLHGEGLMGPLGVEFVDEFIEAGLLLQAVHARWPCCFLFQGQMHAFMTAVLLRMAGFDTFERDAKSQPPH